MELIADDNVPVLPGTLTVDDDFVAIGVFENGVVVQYDEENVAVLISWEDIVRSGKRTFLPFVENVPSEIEKPKLRGV